MDSVVHPEGSFSTLKGNRIEEPIHGDLDEVEVLKRFDSMLRALVCRNRFKLLSKPMTLGDRGHADTLHELCVIYAFDGGGYIAEIRENIQYTVLQAALILTITIGLYVRYCRCSCITIFSLINI